MAEENNIGASRLIGTNGLQQAVDSLTSQVGKLAKDIGNLSTGFQNMTGAANRATGTSGSNMGNAWNASSNRASYSSNGGSGRFTLGSMNGGASNGGGGSFGSLAGMSRLSAGASAVVGVASALTSYANKNMSTNMQLDYFGTQSSIAGGGGRAGTNLARHLAADNNFAALNATDAAKAGYINQYTFGNAQFNGTANPSFVSGMRQANAFGYANPTMGAAAAATAAQQTYSARAAMVSPALGLASPYLTGGVKNSMGNIAQSIYSRTFGSQQITRKQFSAATAQGGSLDVNLQYFGQQLGWNQSTINEYKNVLQGQVAAQSSGMSSSKYYSLLSKAGAGNKGAASQLSRATGMGTSMFENQRNLNAARLTRQNDILDSLAPAFDKATTAVTRFSEALTATLKATGMDKLIGAGAGYTAPFGNALGGVANGLGTGLGLYGAARLLGGGGGLLGGLFARGAGTAAASGGLINATQGASGAYGITTATGGAAAASRAGGLIGGLTTAGAIYLAQGHSGGGLYNDYITRKNKQGFSKEDEIKYVMEWVKENKSEATKRGWLGKNGLKQGAYEKMLKDLKVDKNLAEIAKSQRTTNTDGIGGGANAPTSGGGHSSSGSKATGTNSGATAASVIGFAEQQLGDPYVWGGTGPNGWDCSGLTQWAFGQAGVKLPRTSQMQQKVGKPVDLSKTQPGDLLFNGSPAHHVAMVIGNGKLIEAPRTGLNVRIRSFKPGEFTNARRILGSVGNMNDLANDGTTTSDTLNDSAGNSGGDIGGNYGGTSELAAIMAALGGGSSGGGTGLSSQTSSSSSASTTSSSSPKAATSNSHKDLQSYAKKLLKQYGWSSQWDDFNALEMSEAGWNPKATNPSSGAYGLAQALPASKYNSAGSDWKTNGSTQLRWMMSYIKDRYGSPSKAWSFHQRNNWYDKGAWDIDKDQPATVHKGEMIIPAQQAETIRQTLLNNTFNPNLQKAAGVGGSGTISFGDINITLPSTYNGTAQEAKATGKMVVDAIEERLRIKNLQTGQ